MDVVILVQLHKKIFVTDTTPPALFKPPAGFIQEDTAFILNCFEVNAIYFPTIIDDCSSNNLRLISKISFGGGSGDQYAYSLLTEFTAIDGCGNQISWNYQYDIIYYPAYLTEISPKFLTSVVKGSTFSVTITLQSNINFDGSGPGNCPSFPINLIVEGGPALVDPGSDPCFTQSGEGVIYCSIDVSTNSATPAVLVLNLHVPATYKGIGLSIPIFLAERSFYDSARNNLFTLQPNFYVSFA